MNLNEMQAEVAQINREKGWYDDDRTFGDLIALLHSEVSEALEAYRIMGLTPWDHIEIDGDPENPKPEGVGSELADVLIRLLDMCERYGIDLGEAVANHPGRYGINTRFGDAVNNLHDHISRLSLAAEEVWLDNEPIDPFYAAIYVYLSDWASFLGFDLEAEYQRKVEYNKTRPYRHGGKKL